MRPANLPTLTSLRFFAALMIFVFHLREFAPSDVLYAIAPGMFQGVSFFFVLSGFVLSHANYGREIPLRAFYAARLARIVPLHVVCLLALVAVVPLPVALGQNLSAPAAAGAFVLKLFMLDSWWPQRAVQFSWNVVSWSLSVEMAFYAAFPFLSRAMAHRPTLTLAAAALVSLGVLAAGVAWGLPTFATDGLVVSIMQLGSVFPLARGFEFVLGMAAYRVWRRWIQPATSLRRHMDGGGNGRPQRIGAMAAVRAALAGFSFRRRRARRRAGGGVVMVVRDAAVRAGGGRGRIGRALSAPWLVKLGQMSFAFYLIHVIVMRALAWHLGATGILAPLALSLGLAWLLHEGVEIPMRQRLLARPVPAPLRVRAL